MSDHLARINIAICSCQRPFLLEKALSSLAAMRRPANSEVLVSIIDNDPEQSALPVYEDWRAKFPVALHYAAEPRRGIPVARNRAIAEAHQHNADYLVFIDDDEWVEPEWLCELVGYAQQLGGKAVVHGAVVPELPAAAPAYMAEIFFEKGRPTGTELGSCATNNVLIPIYLTRELGLRFDESRPLAGGTDTLFFCAVAEKGVKIVECAEAKVHEGIPMSRLTSRWLAKRKYRAGITLAWRKREAGRSAVSLLLSSLVQLIVYSIVALLSRMLMRNVSYYKALMKMCRSAGVLSGLLGARTDSYTNIEGH
ncbi:glycosyltransferase family 2 protein [Spongiibacter sp.]|uniref:glycosyltransferase family 2 protein n=1 Tax=Spongiibacter sp. TaxID=2024860 RepID=UPI00356581B0